MNIRALNTLLRWGIFSLFFLAVSVTPLKAEEDPYEKYLKTSKDFKAVKQDKDWSYKAYPSWLYMPWASQRWTLGFGDEAGKFCLENGYNGGFTNRGNPQNLDFFNKFKLRFYMDHTAGKGDLYVNKSNEIKAAQMGPMRKPPLNDTLKTKLEKTISTNIGRVKSSPMRAAYALDDEISWGSFIKPCMWKVTDDDTAYGRWLEEVYGAGKAPNYSGWIGYNDIQPKLARWTLGTFDASQLMDQWTFNDSYWANFLGNLVEYANTVDPETPCGFVGGQPPNAFGGYDYAKVMRKIQFIEAYNIGGSQAVIRSFNPKNAIPAVTTHFHKDVKDTIWATYYYIAHGNRGFIGWVDGWFDGNTPKPWHKEVAPAYLEAGQKLGPLQAQSEWLHDGVAIYYSHASIQLSWILDAEAHGKTWVNRNGDHRLGTSHHGRCAWENMLRDEGIQYSFISYVDVVQNGIPKDFKVLILPATYCLSDAEASRIRDFCKTGGTVIADFLPGCWDQHGKGRSSGGVLDDMFGIKHDPNLQASGVFQDKLWVEVDQDSNFSWKTYNEFLTNKNSCVKEASGFNKAVKSMEVDQTKKFGEGTAVLMNLSPQWYNAYRQTGFGPSRQREVFMKHVKNAGINRWVDLQGAGEKEFGYEITYWKKDNRTIVFVVFNPEITGSSLGGGNSIGLKSDEIESTLKFKKPITDVKDERAGKILGNGDSFNFKWKMNEAIVVSFISEEQ